MKCTRHTAEQTIRKVKTAEQVIAQGKTVADFCRVIEVTQPTNHRWQQLEGIVIPAPLLQKAIHGVLLCSPFGSGASGT